MVAIEEQEQKMGLTDKLKGLTQKAEDTAVAHKDQIKNAATRAGAAVDSRTGGKYHDQIQKAEAKADEMLDKLESSEAAPPKPTPPAA